jgi:hypothetical protein
VIRRSATSTTIEVVVVNASTVLALGGGAIFLLIVLLGLLALLWIVSLLMLVMDSISVGAKILWFLLITLLAPLGIPAYFLWRHSRRGAVANVA